VSYAENTDGEKCLNPYWTIFGDSSDAFFGLALGAYVASRFEGMVSTVLRRHRGTGNRYLRITVAVHPQLELPCDGRKSCVKAISVWGVHFFS
jgi:hypothetical protein